MAIDTHLGLILLNCFSAFGTFMLRQFFLSVNDEIIESARIDGAGHLRTFVKIAVPLVKPALATYAILRFIWTWNDYQNPLIFLRSDTLYTIQIGIKQFADAHGSIYSLMMAAAVSAIVPLLVVFIIGQKQVIEGIALGGVIVHRNRSRQCVPTNEVDLRTSIPDGDRQCPFRRDADHVYHPRAS